ncbi:MAG: GTP-binding protein [Candidatus Verstraetearchaeota archaeon]|nr:GTP-binding protein [Candidatus Verstraetearchaeota archaeon]
MARLIQISGFLGSGKTSSIIKMAMEAQRTGKKTAVIVNEIGDVDVDGEFVKGSGLKAKRILGGCICCSLGSDLVSTIKGVIEEFDPDIIFVEPTGVALPNQVKRFFVQASYIVPRLEYSPTVALVDGYRFKLLLAEFKDFLTKQARDAEILAVTKVDKVDKKFELPLVLSALKEMRPEARVIGISSVTGEGIRDLLECLLQEKIELDTPVGEGEDSVVASEVGKADFSGILKSEVPVPPSEVRSIVAEILGEVGKRCVEDAGKLVGHIKAYAETNGGGFKASLVDPSIGVELSGDLPSASKEVKLSLFMAVRNVDSKKMGEFLEEKIKEISGRYGMSVAELHHHH